MISGWRWKLTLSDLRAPLLEYSGDVARTSLDFDCHVSELGEDIACRVERLDCRVGCVASVEHATLIRHIPEHERIISIEDTPELVIPQPNHVRLFYSKGGQGLAKIP